MPSAFSYLRFSTPKQAEGDSIRRQTELTAAWCARNKVQLDTSLSLRDEGVSAYRGKHRDNPLWDSARGGAARDRRGRRGGGAPDRVAGERARRHGHREATERREGADTGPQEDPFFFSQLVDPRDLHPSHLAGDRGRVRP